jgi:hypothetical protein
VCQVGVVPPGQTPLPQTHKSNAAPSAAALQEREECLALDSPLFNRKLHHRENVYNHVRLP